ncbi:hypothetical protein [Hymenobacter sp. BRD67]|uniref:hypothetical protein n=1 Tax=Hymenobacter sp. BRD67 TaxID=2675877 RepID=UPI001563E915|nr:hypothetical protein [Hymenobacter sp. BRD67]QKG52848.1 hypothetical protein GKZ67_09835 [Hymenobacter sp. BRD67]
MKYPLRFFLLSPLLALLAGCCANNPCDSRDALEDALYFRFDQRGGAHSFSATDIDTVYLLRYSLTNQTASRAQDSIAVLMIQPQRQTAQRRQLVAKLNQVSPTDTSYVVINNGAPFSASGTTGKLSNFAYAILVAPYRQPRYRFFINSIIVQGRYNADGCCTYYQNTNKQFNLNNGAKDSTAVVTESGGIPRPITLRKP